MSGRVLRIKRYLRRNAESVTYQARAVGARDTYTKQSALTYAVETTIFGVVGRATSRPEPQETGTSTKTIRTFHTQAIVTKGGRIVLNDGTYIIDTKPDDTYYKDTLLISKMLLRRLEFV